MFSVLGFDVLKYVLNVVSNELVFDHLIKKFI